MLWATSLSCSKASILLLYMRLFEVPSFLTAARVVGVIVALWACATVLAGFFICRPFAMNWDTTIPGGHCGDQVLSFTLTGVVNLLTDVAVIVLPLPYLYGLQMPRYRKIVLMVVFSLGVVYVFFFFFFSLNCPNSATSQLTMFRLQHIHRQHHPHHRAARHGLQRPHL
jgi:hypothetical protein